MGFRLKKGLRKLLELSGILHARWRNLPNGVYVFNYHRVGDKYTTIFDRAIYSCSTKAFNDHVIAIKDNFTIINTKQLHELSKDNQVISQRYAIITFDDGYIDNYTDAYPILKAHNVSATFYLVTDFLDSCHIPWWDEIAYFLRNSVGQYYCLPNSSKKYDLRPQDIDKTINLIIRNAKESTTVSIDDILADIRIKFPLAYQKLTTQQHQLFINWQQAQEMANNGMEIGSHTVNHKILSQLDDSSQLYEIAHSKKILEAKLKQPIHSIAYPVGRQNCYTKKTLEYSKKAGYLIGFNNIPGRNIAINDPFDLVRFCVEQDDLAIIKFNSCFQK
jgi:peptidoglycan/xylan/chitin deacetylase (PgdA/CDA1 family)